MKKLLFDLLYAQPLGGVKFHGGGEYIKSVFQAVINVKNPAYSLEVCFNKNAFLDDWILEIIQEKNIPVHQVVNANDVINVIEKMEDKKNLRFFTGMIYSYSGVSFPKDIKTYGVCHGLRGLEKPYDREAVRFIRNNADIKDCIRNTILWKRTHKHLLLYFTEILEKFDEVITDSEHSKYSIMVNFPKIAKEKNIRVFYAPSKYVEATINSENTAPYIMMVSANRWLKNCYRGVLAIDQLYQSGYLEGIKTHVYGNLPSKMRNKLKCKNNFIFYDYVESEELEAAYKNCSVFFYPTLNEGFGLPPLEAMKYGKTCVISAICSLPEVYGDSVYYCNPYDIMEMKNRILQAIEHPIEVDYISRKVKSINYRQMKDTETVCSLLLEN